MSFLKNIQKGIKSRINSFKLNPNRDVNLGWFKTKYYKHLPVGKIRTHNLLGKRLYFSSPAELLHGLHEIFIENIYKQKFSHHPYIIDCGANIGMSIIYLKNLAPDATVIAFEPDETNFDLLSKNINAFGLTDVIPYKQAVWDNNTVLNFLSEGSMSSKIEKADTPNTIQVQAFRLKDLINKKVDFLKIDIEGAEYTVLKDIAEDLHFVQNMFVEYHGVFEQNKELTEIIEIINNSGFYYYIKEAAPLFETPFYRLKDHNSPYDVQLNIFCFRESSVIKSA